LEHITPQASSAFTTPVETASWSKYPCAYIKCLKDNSTSLKDQDHMVAKLERRCEWSPAVAQLESDHDPFLCMPEKLAQMVRSLTQDSGMD
jgi:hypothetical protein